MASKRDTMRGVHIRADVICLGVCMCAAALIVAHASHAYIMWAELGHIHSLGKRIVGGFMCQSFSKRNRWKLA